MKQQLLQLALAEVPNAIAALKLAFTQQNPGAPPPTDEEVHQAWILAYSTSLAKDDNWLAAHPKT